MVLFLQSLLSSCVVDKIGQVYNFKCLLLRYFVSLIIALHVCTIIVFHYSLTHLQYFANPNHGGFASNDHCPIQAVNLLQTFL